MDESLRRQVGELFHERWGRLGFDGLLAAERDHVLLWGLHAAVNNGGLDQYLCNSSGDHAEETIGALERVGLVSVAEVLRRTLSILPGGWCAQRDERCQRIAAIPNRWDTFGALTEEYHEAIESEPASDRLAESILAAYRRESLIAEPGAVADRPRE